MTRVARMSSTGTWTRTTVLSFFALAAVALYLRTATSQSFSCEFEGDCRRARITASSLEPLPLSYTYARPKRGRSREPHPQRGNYGEPHPLSSIS